MTDPHNDLKVYLLLIQVFIIGFLANSVLWIAIHHLMSCHQ